jgi:hypothetical protein
MSHRLEENERSKRTNHNESKTRRTSSTVKPDAEDKEDKMSQRHSEGDFKHRVLSLSGRQQGRVIATLLLRATKDPLQTWIRA